MSLRRSLTLHPGHSVHWGVMVPHGWKGELSGHGPADAWAAARDWAWKADALGFDGLWVFDHIQPYPARDGSPLLEAWTTLAALSQVTDDIVLGTLVSCASHRHAAITAKMASTLGVVGAGRFCLGLGAGWDDVEAAAFGIPFGPVAERSDQLEEVLRACRRWWGGQGAPSDEGTAPMAPVPEPRPLMLVGGEGRVRTLRSAAAYADLTNWQVGLNHFVELSAVLDRHCERAGRDPRTIRRTHAPNVKLFETRQDFVAWKQDPARGMSAEEVDAYIRSRGAFYGTVESVTQTVDDFIGAGCGGFMMYCNDSPVTDVLDVLAALRPRQVASHM